MDTTERWRVVLSDGSVREVRVWLAHPEVWCAAKTQHGVENSTMSRNRRIAVHRLSRVLWQEGLVAEVLAPGEPTRAEILSQRDAARAAAAAIRRKESAAAELAEGTVAALRDRLAEMERERDAEVAALRAEVEELRGRLVVMERAVLMADGADYDEGLRDCMFCGEEWRENDHELVCPRRMAEVIRRERKGSE